MRARIARLALPAAASGAAVHLAIVAAGAAGLRPDSRTSAGALLETYGEYSGADNSYGFFAPAVAAEWRAAFDLYDAASGRWTTRTRPPTNRELALLDSTINGHFAREDLREALAASWAAAAMAERPDAAVVVVRAEAFLVPTMEEYRGGARGRWQTLAAFAFTTPDRVRNAGEGATRADAR